MKTAGQRLEELRRERFASRRQAAEALGIPPTTYNQYEAGEREFARHADRFARFFRVNLEWLMTGKGDKRGAANGYAIPLRGIVGAGGVVDTRIADEINGLGESVDLPEVENLGALLVKGDSQYPRFLDGDYVIFRTVPRTPAELVNEFAVVETTDGRSMIKRLRFGRVDGTFNLESFNADLEENVAIDCAYEHVMTIPGRRSFAALKPKRPAKVIS